MDFNAYDSIASELEISGMWRRAAARWLIVMQTSNLSDAQREQIRKRRNHCIARSKYTGASNRIDVHTLINTETLKRFIYDIDIANKE